MLGPVTAIRIINESFAFKKKIKVNSLDLRFYFGVGVRKDKSEKFGKKICG